MNQVLIVNNCQGPHIIQLPHGGGGKVAGKVLSLDPGLNVVDVDTWTVARKNPGVEKLLNLTVKPSKSEMADPRRFNKPMLEVRGELKQPVPALPKAEALALVELTENTDTLAQWRAGCLPEKHVDLIRAINARIKSLTGEIQADPSANQMLGR